MADIELRIDRLDQLFDTLDPAPFRARSLDRDAEVYLLECAEDEPGAEPLRLRLLVPPSLREREAEVAEAVHAHFRWVLERAERRRTARARMHRFAMLLGGAVLLAALGARGLFHAQAGSVGDVLREGLLLLGWVALWRPVEWVLFDTWEHRQRLSALKRLAIAEVRLVDG